MTFRAPQKYNTQKAATVLAAKSGTSHFHRLQPQCNTTVVGTKGLTTAKLMSTDHYTDWHHVSKLRSPDRILHQLFTKWHAVKATLQLISKADPGCIDFWYENCLCSKQQWIHVLSFFNLLVTTVKTAKGRFGIIGGGGWGAGTRFDMPQRYKYRFWT